MQTSHCSDTWHRAKAENNQPTLCIILLFHTIYTADNKDLETKQYWIYELHNTSFVRPGQLIILLTNTQDLVTIYTLIFFAFVFPVPSPTGFITRLDPVLFLYTRILPNGGFCQFADGFETL